MASGRRGMDWPTAWRASLNLYGLAAVLQAFFPIFAVPVWAFFLMTAPKIFTGAKLAQDPWGGRMSPRIYLFAFFPLLVASLLTFSLLITTPADAVPPASVLLTFSVTLLFALGLAAVFMAASAPPSVRAQRGFLGLAVLSEVLSAFVQSRLVTLVVSMDPLETLGITFALSFASYLGLVSADRVGRLRSTTVARRVPRA